MADIKVKVVDRTTLQILEDAKAGDTIDLSSVTHIDTDFINTLIDSELNASYKAQLAEKEEAYKKELISQKENLVLQSKNELNELDLRKQNEYQKLKSLKEDQIQELLHQVELKKNELDNLTKMHNSEMALKVTEEVNKVKESYRNEIESLKNKLALKDKDIDFANKSTNDKLEIQKNRLNLDFEEKLKAVNSEKTELERQLEEYKHEKNLLNVKLQGENLEKWCNDEFINARLAGFENCDWHKDNDAVKDDVDFNDRNTKADYIFKMYADENFNENNVISSVCLEMKSRNPNSKTGNKNKDHYAKLDKDREKKNCEYALLVSELEIEGDNDAPIRKIPGYNKMYMVRPQYMITFLSIIYSLSKQYRKLILEIRHNDEELRDVTEINKEFEALKETYFDKPLITLENQISGMKSNSEKIIDLAKGINDQIDAIVNKTLKTIREKIDTFSVKQKKVLKKIDNLE